MRQLLLCILLWPYLLMAQPYTGQVFNTSNTALIDNTIYALAQGNGDTLYAATDWGLATLVNSTLTLETTTNGLPENSLRALHYLPNGQLLIGTLNSGLVVKQGSSFVTYNTSNSSLPANNVRDFAYQPTDSSVWIGTGSGLVKWKNGVFTIFDLSGLALQSNNVASVAVLPDDRKVVGLINGGFAYFNDTTFTFYTGGNSQLPDNTILDISANPNGIPYMAMPSGGVVAHFGGNVWQTYNPLIVPQVPTYSFHCVRATPVGFMAGAFDKGLVIFKGGIDWLTISPENSNLPDTAVLSICLTADSLLYLGTRNGIWKFDFTSAINTAQAIPNTTLFLNPEKTELLVSSTQKIQSLSLYNGLGQLCTSVEANSTTPTLNLSALSTWGVVHIHWANGQRHSYKIIR